MVDILILHEVVPLKAYESAINLQFFHRPILNAIRDIRPKIILNGHVYVNSYTLCHIDEMMYIRVDSSPRHMHTALINLSKSKVLIFDRFTIVDEISF